MITDDVSDKIKSLWAKYSNLHPKDKTNLIDAIFSEVYDILNNADKTFISVDDYMSGGGKENEKKN